MSPDALPSISRIRLRAQSLAMLDAILCPEWEYRYYSFDSQWGPGEEMASMRNGSGDDWFLLLDPAGAALKGFAHELAHDPELARSIPLQLPTAFSSFLGEPAFSMENASFCFWRGTHDAVWHKLESTIAEDGSDELLALLVNGPAAYKAWAEDYYELPVPLDAVSAVFAHQPLAETLILALNPEADMTQVHAEAEGIAYPSAL